MNQPLDDVDVLSAVRYARLFFNEETDLGKALVLVFDAATRYAEAVADTRRTEEEGVT